MNMKSAVIKFEEEQQKKLNKYQAKQELETGERPNYSEVFFRGLECLIGNKQVAESGAGSDSVDRLRAELEKADSDNQLKAKEIELYASRVKTLEEKLKMERKAEDNPSLAGSENIALRKKIKEISAGVIKDAEKIDNLERLLESMETWELPMFDAWQVSMRNKRMNHKLEQAVHDQEVSS
jgi:hypothetical protein